MSEVGRPERVDCTQREHLGAPGYLCLSLQLPRPRPKAVAEVHLVARMQRHLELAGERAKPRQNMSRRGNWEDPSAAGLEEATSKQEKAVAGQKVIEGGLKVILAHSPGVTGQPRSLSLCSSHVHRR